MWRKKGKGINIQKNWMWTVILKNVKCLNLKKIINYLSSQERKLAPSAAVTGWGLSSGRAWPLASASSVSWQCPVLPGGSFSFEDGCLEEQSREPPAICLSLCTRQDHPGSGLEKYCTGSGAGAQILARPAQWCWQGARRGQQRKFSWTESPRLCRMSHPSRPTSLAPSPIFNSMRR